MVYNIGVIFTRDGNRIVMSLLTLSSSVVKGWIIKRVWGTNAGKRLNAIAMWIGHYAAPLALKPFAPGVPISLLSLPIFRRTQISGDRIIQRWSYFCEARMFPVCYRLPVFSSRDGSDGRVLVEFIITRRKFISVKQVSLWRRSTLSLQNGPVYP